MWSIKKYVVHIAEKKTKFWLLPLLAVGVLMLACVLFQILFFWAIPTTNHAPLTYFRYEYGCARAHNIHDNSISSSSSFFSHPNFYFPRLDYDNDVAFLMRFFFAIVVVCWCLLQIYNIKWKSLVLSLPLPVFLKVKSMLIAMMIMYWFKYIKSHKIQIDGLEEEKKTMLKFPYCFFFSIEK